MIGNYIILEGDNSLDISSIVNVFLEQNTDFQLQGGINTVTFGNGQVRYMQAVYKTPNKTLLG